MVDGLFDNLTSTLIEFCISVIDLLPDSPFLFLDSFAVPAVIVMGYVNWFIDFGTIVLVTAGWLTCILSWYVYQIVLRWIKVIE